MQPAPCCLKWQNAWDDSDALVHKENAQKVWGLQRTNEDYQLVFVPWVQGFCSRLQGSTGSTFTVIKINYVLKKTTNKHTNMVCFFLFSPSMNPPATRRRFSRSRKRWKDEEDLQFLTVSNAFTRFRGSSAEDVYKFTHLLFWSLCCLFIHLCLPCISLALVHHALAPSLAALPRFIKFESISSSVTSHTLHIRTTFSMQVCVYVCVHVCVCAGALMHGLTCGCNPSLICQCLLSHEKPAWRN